MKSIAIPLRFAKGSLSMTDNPRKAIDNSLALLMATPCYSAAADPEYGFIFNNLRFEIFDENEGVVYDSSASRRFPYGLGDLYDKKISGSSNNLNTFAAELRETIMDFEPRLKDVAVSMTYVREERKIYISVKGVIVETEEPYQYSTIINVWK